MPEFTGNDMTVALRAVGCHVFKDLIGKPVRFLEIGVYEGRSALWLLEKVLTHPKAQYDGVDSWEGEHVSAQLAAVKNLIHDGRAILHWGKSNDRLPRWRPETFDGIHIDGCHSYEGALADVRNAWPLLKSGGVILCDDYLRAEYGVARAVHEFLSTLTPVRDYAPVYWDYSIAWRKV